MSKLAIKGVRVFDGQKFGEQTTVVIENGLISGDAIDAEVIDASGKFLLPGLIDAHVHLHGAENLGQLARWGVTTALDMGTWPPALLESLRSQVGVADIRNLDPEVAKSLKAAGRVVVPTLTMMETMTKTFARPGLTYGHARASVISLHTAGVPILAGLSNIEALRAATFLPAEHFGLSDRGIVEVGRRADLIILDKDPVVDIGATRTISRVWCKGIEVNLSEL